MLFTDSDIVTAADLQQLESEVSQVANASKPPVLLEGPGSVCEQTWRECGRQITAAQQMYTSYLTVPGMSGAHVAAVQNLGGAARNLPRTRLNQIVASESQYGNAASAIQMWMAYVALSIFYRNVSARLGKDRFQEKYEHYIRDSEHAWRQLRQIGLPYVAQPLEAPGARHGLNAGTWDPLNLSTVAGAGTAQTVQVAITYYDASKYVSAASNGNGESAPSVVLGQNIAVGQVLRVSIASLYPPTGVMPQVGLSQGSWTPLAATHWSLYVGGATGPLYLQASTPIATKVVTLSGDPVLSGNVLGQGQSPELLLVFQNIIGRG